MQAYRAYFDDGKFIPFEPVKIAKGSQAIVTVLDFPVAVGSEAQDPFYSEENQAELSRRIAEKI